MWQQFFWENIHFAVNLFAALSFFSVFWLYADAWMERKTLKEGLKMVGLLVLSIAFLVESTRVESTGLIMLVFGGDWNDRVSLILRNFGYLFLSCGLMIDPLIDRPKLSGWWPGWLVSLKIVTPLLAVMTAWWYLRRATLGLENHTKKVAMAFYFFAGFEFLQLPTLFIQSNNVNIYRLVSVFGPVWILGLVMEIIGSIILIKWAFSYLLKRINSQLFIITITLILSIFLLITVSFSYLLLKNISDESLNSLETDASVMTFALNSKKSETMAFASVLASNQILTEALTKNDKKTIFNVAEKMMLENKINSVVVLNDSGVVVARGEERERNGDSLSEDQLVKKALAGDSTATIITVDQVVAPEVQIKVAQPVLSNKKVIGVVILKVSINDSLLDEIKKSTGLEIGVFGGDILSATTLSLADNGKRPIGIKESNKMVLAKVFNNGQNYRGISTILNADYFIVYRPLVDVDNNTVGMIQIARRADSIYIGAGKTVETTFIVVGALILLSVVPTYLISEYISNQIR